MGGAVAVAAAQLEAGIAGQISGIYIYIFIDARRPAFLGFLLYGITIK